MLSILNSTATLFITILLGFCAGSSGLFKRGSDQALINYVFYIALPLALFCACYTAPLTMFNLPYLLSYSLAMLAIILISYWLSRRYLGRNPSGALIDCLAVSQVDGAYFALPLFMVVFHGTHLAIPLILTQNIIFFSGGLLLLQISSQTIPRAANPLSLVMQQIGHTLSRNPVISLSLLGLLLGYFQTKIPQILLHNIKFIADSAAPVALFSLGLTCAFYWRSLSKPKQIVPLAVLASLKLLIFPLIALLSAKLLALPSDLLMALVLVTASPAATHTYIVAQKFNLDPQIATFNVVLTTLLSFISINLWLYCLN